MPEDNGMLLLERAALGVSLKNYFPNREQESTKIACKVMKKLHKANITSYFEQLTKIFDKVDHVGN